MYSPQFVWIPDQVGDDVNLRVGAYCIRPYVNIVLCPTPNQRQFL